MANHKASIAYDQDHPYYNGSVQKLYSVINNPGLLVSETSMGGSVFDVGTIFSIKGSDTARAGFRHLVYRSLQDPHVWQDLDAYILKHWGSSYFQTREVIREALEELKTTGLKTHHHGMLSRADGSLYASAFPPELSNLTLIKKYTIYKPDPVTFMNAHFYDYEKYYRNDKFVIPLEYIVRFGVTSGSSILRKYNKLSYISKQKYLNELDIKQGLVPWQTFEAPLVDLTTKYEPEDRNISRQEALLVSGVGSKLFSKSMVKVILASFMVHRIFNKMGLFLWDLKWEIAKDGTDLVIVDTLDTDSVRATLVCQTADGDYIVNFNKQAMRDYYIIMHADWYAAVNQAKQKAAHTGESFTAILKQGQAKGIFPDTPAVDAEFMAIQVEKYQTIKDFIMATGSNEAYQRSVTAIAAREVDYFLRSKNKQLFQKLNSIDIRK